MTTPPETVRESTEAKINVSGSIDLKVNGADSQKVDVVELMKKPEFRARVEEIAFGNANTYS